MVWNTIKKKLDQKKVMRKEPNLFIKNVLTALVPAVITAKHVLIECADLLEIRKKYFEKKSLYSLFRNVIPGKKIDFLREIGVFYKT